MISPLGPALKSEQPLPSHLYSPVDVPFRNCFPQEYFLTSSLCISFQHQGLACFTSVAYDRNYIMNFTLYVINVGYVVPIHQYKFFSDISWGCSTQQRKIGQLDICQKMFSADAAKNRHLCYNKKQIKVSHGSGRSPKPDEKDRR